jgi:hypothetical protein
MSSVTCSTDDVIFNWERPNLPIEDMAVSCHPTFDIAINPTSTHSFLPRGPPAVDDSWVDHSTRPLDISPPLHTHNLQVNTEARSLRSSCARSLCYLIRTFRPILLVSLHWYRLLTPMASMKELGHYILKTTLLISVMRAHMLRILRTRCFTQGSLRSPTPRYESSHLPKRSDMT